MRSRRVLRYVRTPCQIQRLATSPHVRFRPKADIASPLTGNPDLKEFLHSRAVDLPRGKKLAHHALHLRKIEIEDRGNTLCRVAHKLLVLLLREIIVFSDRAPGKSLLVPPGIAKHKCANC